MKLKTSERRARQLKREKGIIEEENTQKRARKQPQVNNVREAQQPGLISGETSLTATADVVIKTEILDEEISAEEYQFSDFMPLKEVENVNILKNSQLSVEGPKSSTSSSVNDNDANNGETNSKLFVFFLCISSLHKFYMCAREENFT
jgi:hypothetical protein